jgi:hypothetical protein
MCSVSQMRVDVSAGVQSALPPVCTGAVCHSCSYVVRFRVPSIFLEDPIYLQSVIIHSANGGKVLSMACRRVLSSTPL